jgi:hypothetical protein
LPLPASPSTTGPFPGTNNPGAASAIGGNAATPQLGSPGSQASTGQSGSEPSSRALTGAGSGGSPVPGSKIDAPTPKEQKAQEESRAATQSICRGC